ncbi:hypothetical protein [Kineosporia babensis]|uniref:Uncharacterized protein n=1 Tax=Kineosporia babensis TaxID=499548 RepID=A0A9X1NMC1_9ACTN|nr:hypothetical protein [Kineosporia babensis]MCD5316366.1 hypothetical protein [Kineosporia babensis]
MDRKTQVLILEVIFAVLAGLTSVVVGAEPEVAVLITAVAFVSAFVVGSIWERQSTRAPGPTGGRRSSGSRGSSGSTGVTGSTGIASTTTGDVGGYDGGGGHSSSGGGHSSGGDAGGSSGGGGDGGGGGGSW